MDNSYLGRTLDQIRLEIMADIELSAAKDKAAIQLSELDTMLERLTGLYVGLHVLVSEAQRSGQ